MPSAIQVRPTSVWEVPTDCPRDDWLPQQAFTAIPYVLRKTATASSAILPCVVDGVSAQSLSPVICQGASYTLPSGRIFSAAGNYPDTLRNIRGCDSIRFTVNLSVSATRFGTASATLCAGQTYTRPSGKLATASGTYLDTLRSVVTGCDSVVTSTLTFRPPLSVRLSGPSSVCTGVSATLTATASGGNGGPYTFSWTGASGSGNAVTVSPSATTKYIVSVSDGCTVAHGGRFGYHYLCAAATAGAQQCYGNHLPRQFCNPNRYRGRYLPVEPGYRV
jgi:hypothetical protein